MYGVKENNLKWFHNYLSNRKQYIEFQNDDKKKKQIHLLLNAEFLKGKSWGRCFL